MKRLLTLLVLACLVSPQAAQAAGYSREDFVRDLLHKPGDTDAPTVFAARYASGFMAGVVDATEGGRWCAPKWLEESEIDIRIGSALNRGFGELDGSAATAMLAFLMSKYPCHGKDARAAPRLLPADLVRDYNAQAAPREQGYAAGYLDGVVESTRGGRWCATADEQGLVLSVVANINNRNWPAATSAAQSMLQQLDKQSPCKSSSIRKVARDGHQSKDADRKAQSHHTKRRHARGGDLRKPGTVRGRPRAPVPRAARTR